jgi:murein DD-endopeptidase MepM/ murein hydrolase activator NlpD
MHIKKLLLPLTVAILISSCKGKEPEDQSYTVEEEKVPTMEFGFNLDDYIVKRDTIRSGDNFGEILQRNNIGYPKIFKIAEKARDTFDIRKLQTGKPYTLLCAKDSLQTPRSFIYQPNQEEYVVINFEDSISAYTARKPIKYVEREASAVIPEGFGISMVLDKKGLSQVLANKMANDIFAWTIDFNRLQIGDRFKIIYTDKFIDDSIYAGVHKVKAVYIEHNKESFYAFDFITDSVKGTSDYYNDQAKSLRRAFLKSPIKFGGRISSRYNLKRRIAHYGYRVKAHRGTDFAAPNGTPILATASGTVTKSSYSGGNGKYVKIRHNRTYETQYLHMSKRAVTAGQFVKQGDVIGYVGSTGSSSGNHVCYRFWKNGKEIDPFTEKLPETEPIAEHLKSKYLNFIAPIKQRLEAMVVVEDFVTPETTEDNITEIQ